MTYLYIASLVQVVFFLFLLFSKKDRTIADKILGSWFILIGIHFIQFFWMCKYYQFTPFVKELSGAMVFLHGPLILGYLLAVYQSKGLNIRYSVHFIPFVLNLALIPVLVRQNNEPVYLIMAGLKLISIIGYASYILYKLKMYKVRIEDWYSNVNTYDLKWFKNIIYFILVIGIMGAISLILFKLSVISTGMDGNLATTVIISTMVFYAGFYGIRQTSILLQPLNGSSLKAEAKTNDEKNKYQKTGITVKQSKELFDKLQCFLLENKNYRESDLTLQKLAEYIDLPSNILSQVINQNYGENFFNYINHLRVNDIIANINAQKHKELTLLALAFDAGFNSKSSFNRGFKKKTGKTPREFIESVS